ncbi:MAG TPA: Lin0512 family protein, partial [Burkholderiales bacterium]|nr:Lin0512 family protein [Burkholderiales bacterium]
HSSLSFVRSLGLDREAGDIEVTIGIQRPEKVDTAQVKAQVPHGRVTVKVVEGGLDVPAADGHDLAVIASAAIAVRFDLP